MMTPAIDLLRRAALVFWDFDGVIKESVEVKSAAFELLFQPHGAELAARVRAHHEAHGGMSRFEKIPVYLSWAGEEPTKQLVDSYCDRFARQVKRAVIDAPWVPGVEAYLRSRPTGQESVLVSATPQGELEDIVEALKLSVCFDEIRGAPTPKELSVGQVLAAAGRDPLSTVLVGDSESDRKAAEANGVPFILRRTKLNRILQSRHRGPSFDHLDV